MGWRTRQKRWSRGVGRMSKKASIGKKKKVPASLPSPGSPPPRDVTRHVHESAKLMLWGKAAGRCEFAGCNKPLWKSSITQEQVNIAQKAHIYAFSSEGPRGNKGIPKRLLNDLANLMLVCHECHKKMDKDQDGGRYTASLLK